jgi:hypothetical protein
MQLAGVHERAVTLADIDDGPESLPKLTRFIILPQRRHGRYFTGCAAPLLRVRPTWWRTAAWDALSAHSRSNTSASTHIPSQLPHSSIVVEPTVTSCRVLPHAEHLAAVSSRSSRARSSPHFSQNLAPANIGLKQEGQLTAASRARQYGHRAASV